MKEVFNKTAFRFVSGFIGMIVLGLMGIVIASYFEVGDGERPASPVAEVAQ